MNEDRTFPIAIAPLVDAGSTGDPEALFRAIERQVEPAVRILDTGASRPDPEKVKWILIEVVTNALTAPVGATLMERTGLSRNALLEAFGSSVLWPHPSAEHQEPAGTKPDRERIASVVGMSVADFMSLPLSGKFRLLGIPSDRSWIRVEVRAGPGKGNFEIFVDSDRSASADDEAEIRKRFEDPGGQKEKIASVREDYVDAEGIYHLPSFTGGGGTGLLACMKTVAEQGLFFDYLSEAAPEGKTRFRLATFLPTP
ncbi:MAG: hypothetical protein ACYTHM_09275 [Planctomycetota bacterium]|jgi:hypothetical protein